MRKAKAEKPEKRDREMKLRFTQTEWKRVVEGAKTADVCQTDYARTRVLDLPISRAPKALTLDRALAARVLGALNEAGSLLCDIKAILSVGDEPLAQSIDLALSKVHMAGEAAMKALESQ